MSKSPLNRRRISDSGATIPRGPSSPLAKLRTSKGFGIGTGSATLLKLYPFLPAGIGAPPGTGSVIAAPGPAEYFISRTR